MMSENKTLDSQVPAGAMVTDGDGINIPPNVLTFALNAITGDRNSITNKHVEYGTTQVWNILGGYTLIGAIPMGEKTAVFLSDGTNSIIGRVTEAGSYSGFVNSTCLGFSPDRPITGVHTVKNGCEDVVYFGDGVLKDMYFNFERYLEFQDGGGNWDCTKFSLEPEFEHGCIEITAIDGGGQIALGNYMIAGRYVSDSGDTTPVFAISQPISIYSSSITPDYDEIVGGFNVSQVATSDGGKPLANKTIQVSASNLDATYNKIQFLLVSYEGGDGVTPRVLEGPIVDILSQVATWSYKGEVLAVTDVGELNLENSGYLSSEVKLIYDNRLLRANLCGYTDDYAALQQWANNIHVYYEVQLTANSVIPEENSRNPKAPGRKSGMRDEIYSLGIVLVRNDGSKTPVFHIPGRALDSRPDGTALVAADFTDGNAQLHTRNVNGQTPPIWDSQVLTVKDVGNITDYTIQVETPDVQHLGLAEDDTVLRWKVYDTSIRKTGTSDTAATGYCAFYQSSTRYPAVKDCDDNLIFPEDPDTPGVPAYIRHHKMPSITSEPLILSTDGGETYHRTLRFHLENITLPSGYVGYYIVRAKVNPTVTATGLCSYTRSFNDTGDLSPTNGQEILHQTMPFFQENYAGTPFQYVPTTANGGSVGSHVSINYGYVACFFSEAQLDKSSPQGSYLRIAYELEMTNDDTTINDVYHRQYKAWDTGYTILDRTVSAERMTNRQIVDSMYVDYDTIIPNYFGVASPVNNYCNLQPFILKELASDLKAYPNIDTTDRSIPASQANNYVYYVSHILSIDPYDNFTSLEYEIISDCVETGSTCDVWPQDGFLTRYVFRRTSNHLSGWNGNYLQQDETAYLSSSILYFTQCRTNLGLRHDATTTCDTLYPISTYEEYLEPQIDLPSYFCEENFRYNPDFSAYKTQSFFMLPTTYTYCVDCGECRPNLVIYSEPSLEDETDDYFRKYLVNNRFYTEARNGPIRAMFFKGRVIYILTEQTAYQVAPTARQFMSSEDTIYVGTGDMFSIPPSELTDYNRGFGGVLSQMAVAKTPTGIVWADINSGNILMIGPNGLENLSSIGMSKYFDSHLRYTLPQSTNSFVNGYPFFDSPDLTKGIGTFVEYDPFVSRVIVQHRDYNPVVPSVLWNPSSPPISGTLVHSPTLGFGISNGTSTFIPANLNNKDYFENLSWTVSFDMGTKSWSSFHSWRTGFMYSDVERLYTNYLYAVWAHDNTARREFYGTRYPFILEFQVTDPAGFIFDEISYIADNKAFDSNAYRYYDVENETFTKAIVYNHRQTTGQMTIVPEQLNEYRYGWDNVTKKAARLDERIWSIGGIRDMVSSRSVPIFTEEWDQVKSYYAGNFTTNSDQGFIDKVINPSAVDLAKNQYTQQWIRGNWVRIRLIADDDSDNDVFFQLLMTLKTYSNR